MTDFNEKGVLEDLKQNVSLLPLEYQNIVKVVGHSWGESVQPIYEYIFSCSRCFSRCADLHYCIIGLAPSLIWF